MKEEGERERNMDVRDGPPGNCPWPGIELATLQLMGQCSTNGATLARANIF